VPALGAKALLDSMVGVEVEEEEVLTFHNKETERR